MQTRELIRRLQEEDPEGDMEVCVGNVDIHFVAPEPAYHDGCLQVLQRDPALEGKCYNITGVEIRSGGAKLNIFTLSAKDALWNDPATKITYDGEYAQRHYKAALEKERKASRASKAEIKARKVTPPAAE